MMRSGNGFESSYVSIKSQKSVFCGKVCEEKTNKVGRRKPETGKQSQTCASESCRVYHVVCYAVH